MPQDVQKPTDEDILKGPTVVLKRPGWNGHRWYPHGFAYPIHFASGHAFVLQKDFDQWLKPVIANVGITVVGGPVSVTAAAPCPQCEATGGDSCVTAGGVKASTRHNVRQ